MQESNRKSLLLRMPVLPLRGMMVFPHMVLHFDVGRPKSVAALEKAMMGDQRIFLVAQMDAEIDEPELSDLCRVGTIAQIKQVLNLPATAPCAGGGRPPRGAGNRPGGGPVPDGHRAAGA